MFGRFAEERLFSPKKVVSVIGIDIIDKNQGQKFHQKQPVGKKRLWVGKCRRLVGKCRRFKTFFEKKNITPQNGPQCGFNRKNVVGKKKTSFRLKSSYCWKSTIRKMQEWMIWGGFTTPIFWKHPYRSFINGVTWVAPFFKWPCYKWRFAWGDFFHPT